MEKMINLCMDRDFYIGLSIGTFACYLFLTSCFISVSRDEKVVHYLQLVLSALLFWSGGSMMMRLQISPGVAFWFHFSILGLFMIPLGIYGFLFCVLEITGKGKFLNICMLVSTAAALLNAFTGCLVPAPEVRMLEDETCAYVYHPRIGIWVWIAAEIVLLIYVTVLAHKKIGSRYEYRRRLGPLLLGTLFLLGGTVSCLMPWGGDFPFDDLGGVGMAACFVYLIYKQYLFSFSSRLITGVVYFFAVVVAFSPVAFLEINIDRIFKQIDNFEKQSVIVFIVVECLWCIFVIAFAKKKLEDVLYQKRKYIVESLAEFQREVMSVVNKKTMYEMIDATVHTAIRNAQGHIFERKEGSFLEYRENGGQPLAEEKAEKLRQLCDSGKLSENAAVAVFQYDDHIFGFLYVELCKRNRLIYDEADCIRQIGNSVSGVLKSIDAYEELYQASIHDELTGLYNWKYCLKNLDNHDLETNPMGMIYLDMDNFKLYNELYGEKTGDQILRWCAAQIKALAEEDMQVFRVGSNEFLVIAPDRNKNQLISLAKQIQKTILEPKEDKPKVIQLFTFSIGIAWDGTLAGNAELMFRQARRAAFYAKENGKNRIEIYEKRLEGMEQNRESDFNQISPTVFALMAAIDAKDSFTFEHSENVSEYAEKLAMKLQLPQRDIQTAKIAGLLHDIGKIGIPENVLKKQGKLTDEEYEIIKTHVEKSVEMIRFLPNMDYVIPAVVSHHERYDGKGYPNGIKGTAIPILGRILTVCDSFDAMVSRRAYKKALSVEYALGELERGKGTQFDPVVAQAFMEMVQEEPDIVAHG